MFSLKLKELRENCGLSQKAFSQKIGVSQSTVGMWESNKREPNFVTTEKIADFFNVSTDYLLGRETPEPDYEWMRKHGEYPYNPKVKKIPVLGYVAAGKPIFADEHIIDYTFTDVADDEFEYFALKVKGDSMSAAQINDGNIVIVRVQQTCENGDIVVVRVDDENATVKLFHRVGNTLQLIPKSLNPEHKIQEYDLRKTKIDIVGKVVECKIKF